MAYEQFVEITRNDIVESRHFGAAVVCDHKGNVVESWGDVDSLIFPRSAIKPMQAINLVESGASEHFTLNDKELSMACSSHYGEEIHQKVVTAWLKRLGLGENDLACGVDLPIEVASAHKLLAAGNHGSRICHNCSGKHTGFLTTALHLGMPIRDYHLVEHPVQQYSLDTLCDVMGFDLRQYPIGNDGCGFPATTMPLADLGRAVARYANPSNFSDERARAVLRLQQAVTREPVYTSGHGTVVSDLNQVTQGSVLSKTGAEGILTAALPERGLGIALKIADGNSRAVSAAMLAILDHLGALNETEINQLQHHITPQIKNSRGLVVGEIRPAEGWLKQ